jgi:hypothetical protein
VPAAAPPAMPSDAVLVIGRTGGSTIAALLKTGPM